MMWMGVMERVAGFKSNNEYEVVLQTSTQTEKNLSSFLNRSIDELPSIDSFCYFFQNLPPVELHNIIVEMFRALERKNL